MSESVDQSVRRLNQLLPLKSRQERHSQTLKDLHRAVIKSLVTCGRPPSRSEVAALVGEDQVDASLALLGGDDLIVLSRDRREILGAYPVTSEKTPHEVHVNGQLIHAMCSLDALSVGPMYDIPVEIYSRCRVTGTAVCIKQDGARILEATPPTTRVGVRWQMPSGDHAAHSMCMEMVFLKDDDSASNWHQGDLQNHSLFTLEQAAEIGARFFKPLL